MVMAMAERPNPADAATELLARRRARRELIEYAQYMMPDYDVNWHHRLLAETLESVGAGEIKRLIVTMPPQHGKSTLVSVLFPTWTLGRNPKTLITQCGYADSITLLHSRNARAKYYSTEFHSVFPDVSPLEQNTRDERHAGHEWETKEGGSYYAVGVGGGLTGRGFDIGIIDDPYKDKAEADSEVIREARWQWYTNVFITRLRPEAAIIIVMTRWHTDDLVGKVLELEKTDPVADKWEILHLRAICEDGESLWPSRYDMAFMEKMRATQGSRDFTALYQGSPTQATGNIVKREWFQYYRGLPKFERIISSWDTALKDKKDSAYSVGLLWGVAQNAYYLIDVWRAKVGFPELKRAFLAFHAKHHVNAILVEDKASGISLIQELQNTTRLPILPIQVDKDKVARLNSVTPLMEAKRVWLPVSAEWLHDYVEELCAFPVGKYADQVDTTSQALSWMSKGTGQIPDEPDTQQERREDRDRAPKDHDGSLAGVMRRQF